jgi:hypothetical protein
MNGNAQDLDEKYIPKGGVFTKENKSTYTSDIKSNLISYSPFLLLRGINAIFYERRLGEFSSLKLGIGKNLGNDPIFMSLSQDFELIIDGKESLLPYNQIDDYSTLNPKFNLFAAASLKYFVDDVFDGSYFELLYRRNTYKYTAQNGIYGYTLIGDDNFKASINSYYGCFGFQFVSSSKLKLSHDFYFGGGIRSVKMNIFEITSKPSQGGNSNYYYQIISDKSNAIYPSLICGYSLGFNF